MTSHDPDFWAKAGDVCGLYLNPPDNALVWSVDEKTGIQAKSRVNPTRPAIPTRNDGEEQAAGIPIRASSSTAVTAPPSCSPPSTSTTAPSPVGHRLDPRRQLRRLPHRSRRADPAGMQLHCIVDNLSAHGTPAVEVPRRPTLTCTCISPRPTPRGSTRSSCGSRSWNDDSSATASSTPSMTSPTGSSNSSRPTTVQPNHSGGPTTPAHSKSHDIAMIYREPTSTTFAGGRAGPPPAPSGDG